MQLYTYDVRVLNMQTAFQKYLKYTYINLLNFHSHTLMHNLTYTIEVTEYTSFNEQLKLTNMNKYMAVLTTERMGEFFMH